MGGGSGGHVTPVVAVLRELRERQPDVEIRFWCDRKFAPQARSIMGHFDKSIPVLTIHAGKFRRYNAYPMWQQLLRPSIVLPNLLDMLLVGAGFVESLVRLAIWRPDVVFTKGGFVCLPVGIAARILGVPLVIHDSDAHPGLTNRVLAKGATLIATGAPLHFYQYPKSKARYVGIPIAAEFRPFSIEEQKAAKKEFGFEDRPLLVVTGGGLGAKRLNDAVVASLDALLPVVSVLLISGAGQYDELLPLVPKNDSRFQLKAFVSEGMARILGGADLVIARAGATTIMELAALAKPTILVPNAYLTGGHQLKNAAVYAEKEAVAVLNEEDIESNSALLSETVVGLLSDGRRLQAMQEAFVAFAKPKAAKEMADMILQAADKS